MVKASVRASNTSLKRLRLLVLAVFAFVGAAVLTLSHAEDTTKVIVDIPDSNFAIPAGAIYVSPTGNDSAAGTEAAPFKTLKYAVSRAGSGTVVMRKGVYREAVSTITKPVTIQAYPHEKVWLDGSDEVTGWVQEGSLWRKDGWTAAAQMCPKTAIPAGEVDPDQPKYYSCYDAAKDFVTPENPLSFLPDMLFVDGIEQRQVRTKSEVVVGTFYIDQATSRLYTGTNPGSKLVEASTRQQAIQYYQAGVAGAKLRGIGVRRFSSKIVFTSKPGQVEVSNGAKGIEFDKMLFTQSASNGLLMVGSSADKATGLVVRDSVFANNGASGLSGNYLDGLVLDQNIIYNNNTQKVQPEGRYGSFGGAKISRLTNSTVRNNLIQDNYGNGFWCDLACQNNKITGNMSRGNIGHGLYYEISYGGLLASNVVYDNTGSGIKASGQGIKIFNNTAYSNGASNIFVYDDPDTSRISSSDIQVKNNIVAAGPRSTSGVQLIRTWMGRTNIAQTITALDNNLYFRSNAVVPKTVLTWQGTSPTVNYATLDATLRSQTGRETNGLGVDGKATATLFKDAAMGNFQLVSGAAAVNVGEALPADVAAALGQSTGVRVHIGALSWRAGSSNTQATATPDPVTPPTPPANKLPTVTVNVSSASISAPASFNITGSASDPDGTISKIEILQNGATIASCYNTTSCTYQAKDYQAGEFNFSARATDNATPAGLATSTSQNVTVLPVTPVALAAPMGVSPYLQQDWFQFYMGLKWTAVPGATSYVVTQSGSNPVTVTNPNFRTGYTITIGYRYNFEVAAVNATQKSAPTSVIATSSCGFWVFNCNATSVR